MAKIATVTGTALVPGISKNGRLYTAETIAKAVHRAQKRLSEGAEPLTMLTHHAADDDSTRIVGRITGMSLAEDGSAKFTADIADTDHARTIAGLVDPAGGTPFLKGVSIRGAWVGKVRRERTSDGQAIETADDLELDGLDYTRKPGVAGALIDTFEPALSGTRESEGRHLIYESAEALVTITEDTAEAADFKANTKPPGATASDYADPGYQADKKKRYLLDTKARAKAAWSYINQADNQKPYTGPQLKRIKQRIVKALKKFGVEVNTSEGYLVDPIGQVTETALTEYADDYPSMAGSFCIELCNGPLRITISSYCVDPADLDLIGRAAMDGACMALKSLDPDMDGDMDVPGADAEDTDDDMESAAEAAPAERLAEADEPTPEPSAEPAEETEDPAPDPAAVPQNEEEEPAVSEPTTPAVEPTPAATDKPAESSAMDALNAKFDKLTDAISGLVSKMAPAPAVAAESAAPVTQATQETAPAKPAAEAPKEVAETQEQMIARLVAEGVKAERTRLVQELAESGQGPARKGLVAPVNEHTAPVATGEYPEGWPTENGSPKPLHKWSDAERREHMFPALEQYVLGSRAR